MFFSRLFPTLLLIVALQTDNACSKLLVCNQPRNFTVQLSDTRNVVLSGSNLTILCKENITVHTYPHTNAVNIELNDAVISFNATMQFVPDFGREPEKVWLVDNGHAIGVGELKELTNNVYSVSQSRFFLQSNANSSIDVVYAVEKEVLVHAKNCIAAHMCDKLKLVKSEQLRFSTDLNKFGPFSATSKDLEKALSTKDVVACDANELPAQVNGNFLVDHTLEELKKKLKAEGKYTVDLPNVKEEFHRGSGIFKINGKFEAADGTFENISTIVRNGEAQLIKKGLKYSAKSAFEFKTALVKYKSYKFSYGFLRFGGTLSGDVTGMTVQLNMTFDFGERKCIAKVEDMTVTNLGKLDLKLTGLGPINRWVSQIMSYYAKLWHKEAVHIIKEAFIEIIDHALVGFDCRKLTNSTLPVV